MVERAKHALASGDDNVTQLLRAVDIPKVELRERGDMPGHDTLVSVGVQATRMNYLSQLYRLCALDARYVTVDRNE